MACNGCVDVCPESLIRLVPVSEIFGVETEETGAAMIKDETTCIRCALCASRCPTHAILMKHFDFSRSCVTVPTRNPKVRYVGQASRTVAALIPCAANPSRDRQGAPAESHAT